MRKCAADAKHRCVSCGPRQIEFRSKLMVPVTGFVRSAGLNLRALIGDCAARLPAGEMCRRKFCCPWRRRNSPSPDSRMLLLTAVRPAVSGAPAVAKRSVDPIPLKCAVRRRGQVGSRVSLQRELALPFIVPAPHFSWKIAADWAMPIPDQLRLSEYAGWLPAVSMPPAMLTEPPRVPASSEIISTRFPCTASVPCASCNVRPPERKRAHVDRALKRRPGSRLPFHLREDSAEQLSVLSRADQRGFKRGCVQAGDVEIEMSRICWRWSCPVRLIGGRAVFSSHRSAAEKQTTRVRRCH